MHPGKWRDLEKDIETHALSQPLPVPALSVQVVFAAVVSARFAAEISFLQTDAHLAESLLEDATLQKTLKALVKEVEKEVL